MSTVQPPVPSPDLEDRLLRSVREGLGIEIPAPDLDLLDSGLIDSLTFVELLVLVEEEFGVGVDLADLDLDDFRSVRRIAAFLARRQGVGNGSG